MPPALPVLGALAAAACLAWMAWEFRALRRERATDPSVALLQQQLDALRLQLQQAVAGVSDSVAARLDRVASQVDVRMADLSGAVATGMTQQSALQQTLQSSLQGLDQTGRQVSAQLAHVQAASARVEELGRSLNSLQEILRPTKQRGEMGETFLRSILEQSLPAEHLAFQHPFRSGVRVDAVVRTPHGLVPIDSKFPMEAFLRIRQAADEESGARARQEFRRALKLQIDEIASKYVCPDEGTLDFAFMYIPAEGIYQELLGDDLAVYARGRRVIPVSPNTLFAYLQTVLLGLKGLRIEAEARSIREGLARVQGDLQRALGKYATLGTHLRNAAGAYAGLDKDLGGIETRLSGLAGGDAGAAAPAPAAASRLAS